MEELSIKQKRVMMYFIEATERLIVEEGVEGVSIKKIAEEAGYNSATLYNYFENLEVLILYASVHYLKIYLRDLKSEIHSGMTAKEMYQKVYEIFARHSFREPEIFYTLFFGKYSDKLEGVIRKYYQIFPGEYEGQTKLIQAMLSQGDIFQRDRPLIEEMVQEGSISEEKSEYIMESVIRIHHSYLMDLLQKKISLSLEEYSNSFLKIFHFLIHL